MYQISHKIISFILILFCVIFSLPCVADNSLTPEQFISQQEVIRVISDGSTQGYGNQVANLNMMKRLRQMGFNGTFELIYPDTTVQIPRLFGLPDTLPAYYEYIDKNNKKTILIKYSECFKRIADHRMPIYAFGISGELEIDKMTGWDAAGFFFQNIHLLELSNTQAYVQASGWPGVRHTIYAANKIETLFSSLTPSYDTKPNKFIVFPITDLTETEEYLKKDIHGQQLLNKNPGLVTFIQVLNEKNEKVKANILPVYGWPITSIYINPEIAEANMLQIIAGAHYAQMQNKYGSSAPLIIPVFYEYMNDGQELIKILHGDWGNKDPEFSANANSVIHSLSLDQPGIVSVASISDPETSKTIEALKPGQILILSMGSLPNIVFDGIFLHTGKNIWPAIHEGVNTLNSLIQTGRPFFRCRNMAGGWLLGFDLVKDADLKARLQNLYRDDPAQKPGFCGGIETWKQNISVYQMLGDMIIEAQDPNSALSNYFQTLKSESLKPENDAYRIDIEEAMKLLRSDS